MAEVDPCVEETAEVLVVEERTCRYDVSAVEYILCFITPHDTTSTWWTACVPWRVGTSFHLASSSCVSVKVLISSGATSSMVTFGHLCAATRAKSAAVWTVSCRLSTAVLTARFTVPPTPSTAPLPWLVAKKCHSTWRLGNMSWKLDDKKAHRYLFLNWEAAPSLKMWICLRWGCFWQIFWTALTRNVATAFLSWSRLSLTTTYDKGSASDQATEVKMVTCFWFQWADWISSWYAAV